MISWKHKPECGNVSSRRYRSLTILHSNDMHGDFLTEEVDEKLVGGVSYLSGYIDQTRRENPNTLYMIAGDMFRGSLIDTEFQGISTIEIMNLLGPDVVSLGNHEVDYGIAHLLFLERCCRFPIVNANVYIKTLGTRLFNPYQILEVDGMKILVIGILTEEIMNQAKKDLLLGSFVNVEEAAHEVGVICDSYRSDDIDFTILLTHIGFEQDKDLASQLDPRWGVDLIIGGHSHTLLDQPEIVNGIPIVQAGVGTDQLGRMDLVVDTDTNSIVEYSWKTIPIGPETCPRNEEVEDLIRNYKKITDEKYGVVLTRLLEDATHPSRYQETSAGNLLCDVVQESLRVDLVMLGSGSLRKEMLPQVVTRGALIDLYPYQEKLIQMTLTGAELKAGMKSILSKAPTDGSGHGEYYQISQGFAFEYEKNTDTLVHSEYHGQEIGDEDTFSVVMEGFHAQNLHKFLELDAEAVEARQPFRTAATDIRTVLEESMRMHRYLCPVLEGRTRII